MNNSIESIEFNDSNELNRSTILNLGTPNQGAKHYFKRHAHRYLNLMKHTHHSAKALASIQVILDGTMHITHNSNCIQITFLEAIQTRSHLIYLQKQIF